MGRRASFGDAQATEATKTAKAAAMQQVKIGVAEHISWTSVRGGSGPSPGRRYFSSWGSSMSGPLREEYALPEDRTRFLRGLRVR